MVQLQTFKIGDAVKYRSRGFDLVTTGYISGITDKTVTIILPNACMDERIRLKLADFEALDFIF